jgi:hypothetical protein
MDLNNPILKQSFKQGLENIKTVGGYLGKAEDWLDDKIGINNLTPETKQAIETAVNYSPMGMGSIGKNIPKIFKHPDLNMLLTEAKKYPTFEDFRTAFTQKHLTDLSNPEKHIWGRALSGYSDEPLTDISEIIKNQNNPGSYYSTIKYSHPEVFKKISSPENTITMYRAVPFNIGNNIRIGDYIALDKKYAILHGESVLKGEQGIDYKILSKKVSKEDVVYGGADFSEWTYSPKKLREEGKSLQNIFEKSKLKAEDFLDTP